MDTYAFSKKPAADYAETETGSEDWAYYQLKLRRSKTQIDHK